jgi:hypothetical protein
MAARRTIQAVGQVQPSANYGPDREDCLVSGSLTLSASLGSTETLRSGDQITAVFASCNDGDGEVYNGQLRIDVQSFAGRIDYGTTTPFQSVDGDYPATGVLRIDGANGTSVVVTALNEENLQLAIDSNGDTIVDETRLMDWSSVPGW